MKLDYETAGWRDEFPFRPIGLAARPVVFFGPRTYLGDIYATAIIERCRNPIAAIDDRSADAKVCGLPRWTTAEFCERARGFSDLILVDLTAWPMGYAMFRRLAEVTGVQRADLVAALAELDLPAVYQTPVEMRERTIARQADWLAFRRKLADERSRQTLDAALLLRLTCDRRWVRSVMIGPEEEYFSFYASDMTFRLGHDEIICDAGAYVGDTVRKAIASTGGCFRRIDAFEPDRLSFSKLQEVSKMGLENVRLHNCAVGDFTGRVSFRETGNTGSHVDQSRSGTADAPITTLDDAVEEVTFIKMDLEGFESRALMGARRLIVKCRPRMAITGYHYADDLLNIVELVEEFVPDYELRLRHHSSYYYDTIIYAAPNASRAATEAKSE